MESIDAKSEFDGRSGSRFNERVFIERGRCFVQKALVYAVDCHSGQFRKSGEPYIIHPIQVAGIYWLSSGWTLSPLPVVLHDVVEDTDATLDDLERVRS